MQRRSHKLVLARETVRVLTVQDLALARIVGGRDTDDCDPVHLPDTLSPIPTREPDTIPPNDP